jgi:uncharacterized membrane protein YccC
MALAALAVGVPLIVGVAISQVVAGVFMAVGGLVGALADRVAPFPLRLRRVAAAGVVGGVPGLLIGTVVNGRGWLTVVVLVLVAALSAVLSSINPIWSTVGMFVLAYAALGTGPLGAVKPWWFAPLWMLTGVGWMLLLLTPGWLRSTRAVEQRRVAAVYRALAANLRALGTDQLPKARQAVGVALNVAREDVLGQRAVARGRDLRLARLVALLDQARLVADAAAALAFAGERPPPRIAEYADRLAAAIEQGRAVPSLVMPSAETPGMVALCRSLAEAGAVVSGRTDPRVTPDVGTSAAGDGRPVAALVERVRSSLSSTFAARLILCIGVAAVFSEVLPLQRSYWVILTVAVVMKPDFGSVFARALQYAAGTLLGAVLAALILAFDPPEAAVLAVVVLLSALIVYGMSRNYGLFGVFFTPLIILIINLLIHGGWPLAEARLVDVALGCAVVLLLGYALWPSSWHANVRQAYAEAIDATASYLQESLADRRAPAAVSAHIRARRQIAALSVELQRALAEPQPVQGQLTALHPAVVALERLVEAVTAAAVTLDAASPADDVGRLSGALRTTADEVRSGTPERPGPPLPTSRGLAVVGDAVRGVQLALAEQPVGSGPSRTRVPAARLEA